MNLITKRNTFKLVSDDYYMLFDGVMFMKSVFVKEMESLRERASPGSQVFFLSINHPTKQPLVITFTNLNVLFLVMSIGLLQQWVT